MAFDFGGYGTAVAQNPFGGIQADPSVVAGFGNAMNGQGQGMSNALSAANLQLPQSAQSRIQQEMMNFGRVGAAQGALGYEMARGQMNSQNIANANQMRSAAAISAMNFNQNLMQQQAQNSQQGQSYLMQMLAPFISQMQSHAGYGG